jgi:hypothetical protein
LGGDTPLAQHRAPAATPITLRRALGRRDLAAIGINQTIGGALFLMPSQFAAVVGILAPAAGIFLLVLGVNLAAPPTTPH